VKLIHSAYPVLDPVAVFEQALVYQKASTKVSDYEIENQKLRETLAEYNTEFAEVKNQGIFTPLSALLSQ